MSTKDRDEILVDAIVRTARPTVKALVSTMRAHFAQERVGLHSGEHPTDECGECQTGNVGFSEHSHNSACDDDPDEALASVLEDRLAFSHSWLKVARAAREHIEVRIDNYYDTLNKGLMDDLEARAEQAEAAMREEVEEHDKTRAAVLRLTRDRDEAERRRIVGDKRIRQLEARVESLTRERDETERLIRVWHRHYADRPDTELVIAGNVANRFADLLPEDEQ